MRTCWLHFRLNWIWFIVSIIACLALGFIYEQKQARTYQRQGVILIENAETGGQMGSAVRKTRGTMNTLMELNGISVGDNLKNEIFILTSRRLMERVVDTLRLDVDYTMPQSLHEITLYNDRPFNVSFEKPAQFAASFKVRINENNTFTLHEFKQFRPEVEDANIPGEVTMRPGEEKRTPIGTLRIDANKNLGKFTDCEINITHLPQKMAAALYSSKVSANEYDKESSLIVLGCKDNNAKRAEDIICTIYDAYKRDVVENKNRIATSTEEFIDKRLSLISEDLSGIENQMMRFKRDNQLIDIKQTAQAAIAESAEARRQTIELETQVSVARYLTDFLQDRSKHDEAIPMLSLPSAGFTPLISEYNQTMIERNRLLSNSSASTPAIRDIDNRLASLRTSLLASISSYVTSIELQLQHARSTESAISSKMNTVPEKERESLDIQRQLELKAALYTYLLNKREEVSLQKAISEANVRMVEEPLGSTAPVSPRRAVILLISFFMGIFIPAAIIWLRQMLDVTVSGRKDVEEATTIPIVGEIPHWEDSKNCNGALIENAPTDAPIVEAFRVLRYGLNFMRHSAKVFIITSATPKQGKSFISSNFAFILGTTGKRVLYIDTDIRKRTASKTFGNTGGGLTALLVNDSNDIPLTDMIIPDGITTNVDFLPAGKMPPNPSELLMSDKLDEIVEEAKTIYDYIVIDTTPMLSVADANIVNRVADITIFAIRAGVQERAFLPELEKMYKAKNFRNLCIAINDANVKKGYGYSYGYGYGYGNNKEENKSSKSIFPWKK